MPRTSSASSLAPGWTWKPEWGQERQRDDAAGDYAEDLAATMLATTLGIEFDPNEAWDQRKKVFRMGRKIVKTKNITQSAVGDKNGRWTTVLASAVFIPGNGHSR